jgi:hypothetical protein
VGRAIRSWPRDAHLGYAEGIWLGLAVDASHGVLYRPIDGPQGIGGSRYFPLYYLAIAAGMSAGLAPIVSGYVTTAVSVAVLISGIFVLLRRLGVDQALAIAASAVALACQPAQMALLATRGDALAAGLAMWGLASCAARGAGWRAPLLFALAFVTKPTSVYAPVAASIAWIGAGHSADAKRLALRTLTVVVAIVGVIAIASGGRMISVLASSGGGGAGLATMLAAPVSAVHILRRVPESAFFVMVAAALVAGLILASRSWRLSILQSAWLACGAVTLAIYASPATIENHLIDLTSLSIVMVAASAHRASRWSTIAAWLLIAGGVAAGASALRRSPIEDLLDRRAMRREVLTALADIRSPILFDQPMLAVQRGEAPYLLDQYVSSIRFARDPRAIDSLVHDVEAKKFGAIVFENQAVDLSIADAFPGQAGERLKAAIDRSYALETIVAERPIYRPK